MVPLVQLVIKFDEAIINVGSFQYAQVLRRNAQADLKGIDGSQVLHQQRWIGRRLSAPLPFIIQKEKRLVFADGAAQRPAKLVLAQDVESRLGQNGFCVGSIVLKVVVDGAMNIVSAGLGDDIHNAAQGASVFRSKAVVDHAKFA